MDRNKTLKQADALKFARATFNEVLGNSEDPNARIIGARRGNKAHEFKPLQMMKRAKSAKKHVTQAKKALKRFEPSLGRFKQ